MAKQINTRIKLRYDSFANWTSKNPVLLAGEIAIATIESGNTQAVNSVTPPQSLIKVGDGTSNYNSLPFISALAADVYSWAKAATKPEYQASEITGLADFISGEIEDTDFDTRYTFDTSTGALVVKKTLYTKGVAGTEETVGTYDFITTNELNSILSSYVTDDVLAGKLGDYVTTDVLNVLDLGDFSNEAGYAKRSEVESAFEEAKKYADDNDANATYSLSYDSTTQTIKLIGANGGETTSIDAAMFIKDGMLEDVSYDAATNTITFTWNTATGGKTDTITLTDLLDPYTAVDTDTIDVTIDGTKISADIKEGSIVGAHLAAGANIVKTQLASAVQNSLTAADNAVPKTTTVNGKALSSNITLSAADVDAATSADITAAIGALDSSATATTGSVLTGIAITDGKITSKTEVNLANTYATKAEVEALTTDDIEGGTETWIFNCGTASTVI